ncbi:Hypothetical protein (Fragment) [Durusdinium trenchii]|uniref:RING-type domain-containing protein n=1 Tax=Durusdinium trenchii TaxID=1381693 RepID=A0ABP0R045_9DINO
MGRSRPGEVGDVEAAGVEEPKSPRSVSSVSLSSETERSSTVEAVPSEDGEAIAEQVKAERWQCDLCFEPFLKFETPWQLGGECGHSLCRRCVLGSIRWGGRCPYDNTPIPAIVVCGAMGTGEYVYHEKLTEARRTGGVPCSVSDCPGVAPSTGTSGTRPSPSSCNCCGTRHCGRTVCGVPWSAGHRCWDILEQEVLPPSRGHDFQSMTRRRLMSTPRFRPCPQCGVMVEHTGGCNMVYHDTCRTRWCFICRRVGTCQDFDCKDHMQRPTPIGPGRPCPPPRPFSWREWSCCSSCLPAISSAAYGSTCQGKACRSSFQLHHARPVKISAVRLRATPPAALPMCCCGPGR